MSKPNFCEILENIINLPSAELVQGVVKVNSVHVNYNCICFQLECCGVVDHGWYIYQTSRWFQQQNNLNPGYFYGSNINISKLCYFNPYHAK